MDIKDCIPAKEAAVIIGITYELFMARVRKNPPKPPYDRTIKLGWGRFMHKDDVAIAKRIQQEKDEIK